MSSQGNEKRKQELEEIAQVFEKKGLFATASRIHAFTYLVDKDLPVKHVLSEVNDALKVVE